MSSRLLFLLLALALVLVSRLLASAWLPVRTGDFELLYASAMRLLEGETPYQVGAPWIPYPLPAVLLAVPFTLLPLGLARPLFDVLVGWALVYALWRYRGLSALLALLSGSYLFALFYGHPAPLMLAAGLIPALGFLLAVRPNTSVALWVARPSWAALAGLAGFVAVSLLVLPTWPRDWWMTLPLEYSAWEPPILRPFGALVLLGALRWRLPEGRLLLATAFLPQTTLPYELIPLALIPAGWGEMVLYVAGTWIAVADAAGVLRLPAIGGWPLTGWPVMLFAVYLPMLFLVLRRPGARRVRKDGGSWIGKERRRPHRLRDDELRIESREHDGQHSVTVTHLPTRQSVTESGATRQMASRKAHDKLAALLARTARLAKKDSTNPE
jgi:hypothetical protein